MGDGLRVRLCEEIDRYGLRAGSVVSSAAIHTAAENVSSRLRGCGVTPAQVAAVYIEHLRARGVNIQD